MKVYNTEIAIEEIIKLRYKEFKSLPTIVTFLVKKYGIGNVRAYDLIKMARERIGEAYEKADENIFEDALNTLESMKEGAHSRKEYKLAFEIQKELNKVKELYVKKIDITTNGESLNIKDLLNFKDDRIK
jgi:predicted S18 family serine protease